MVVAVPIITIFYMRFLLPEGPSFMPNLTVGEIDQSVRPTIIEERYLSFNGYFDIFDIIIREDRRPCGNNC